MKKILVSLFTNPAIEITGMKILFEVQKKLIKKGYEIHMVTPNANPAVRSKEHHYRKAIEWENWLDWFKEKEKETGIKFHVFNINLFRNVPFLGLLIMRVSCIWKIIPLLIKEDFDVFHDYFSNHILILQAFIYRIFFKKKIFCTLCSNVNNKNTIRLIRFSLHNKWINRIFFFDRHSLNQFKGTHFSNKTTWLSLGCDYETLYKSKRLNGEIKKIQKELKRMRSDKIILFLGPLVERKGPFELTAAFKDTARFHKDTILVFATPPVSKKAIFHNQNKKKIMDLAGEFANRIRFLEGVHNVAALMISSDIIAVPLRTISGTLSYPLTLLEALRSNHAIIASNISGNKEIIQDGFNGMLYNTQKEFADKLNILLSSPALRKELGEKAMKDSCKYELKNCVDRITQFYEE